MSVGGRRKAAAGGREGAGALEAPLAQKPVAFLGGLCLAVVLFAAGFFVCACPWSTRALSSATSEFDLAPYDHDDLVDLACATRDVTVDPHPGGWQEAREGYCSRLVEAAQRASASESAKAARWTRVASVVDVDGVDPSDGQACAEAEARLAAYSDSYALGDDAFSHLEDCNKAIFVGCAAFVALAACAVAALVWSTRRDRALAAKAMRRAALAAAVALGACLTACVVDFDSFFSLFHAVLFPQGNWTFSARSLLICMLPTGFWVGMGALWLSGSALACIVVAVAARHVSKGE